MARNATGGPGDSLDQRQYVLQDRDSKFCSLFRATLKAGGIKPIPLPATKSKPDLLIIHGERNHQGKGNTLLLPSEKTGQHRPREIRHLARGRDSSGIARSIVGTLR